MNPRGNIHVICEAQYGLDNKQETEKTISLSDQSQNEYEEIVRNIGEYTNV